MTYSVHRLSLFAAISAIESDLRRQIAANLTAPESPETFLGPAFYAKAKARCLLDDRISDDEPILDELLPFLDFSEAYQVLNQNRHHLPESLANYVRSVTADLDKLVPVRNRVMHGRPLDFDDFSATIDTAHNLIHGNSVLWSDLAQTLSKLDTDPGFVLALDIPRLPLAGPQHNLPVPDFDETGFLGRDEQLKELIKLCKGPYPVITILGEGGIGKTALALKVAYSLLDLEQCPFEAIIWTTAKAKQLTTQGIKDIDDAIKDSIGMLSAAARALSPRDLDDPAAEVLKFLEAFPILLILDNLETVLDERLRDFLSDLPKGSKVLITSRIGTGAPEFPVRLPPMREAESIQLLRSLAKSRALPDLTRTSNKVLVSYCSRMANNPLFIKWFVSLVQSGIRPEEALANQAEFLDFAMTNVYSRLAPASKHVLKSLISVPGAHCQAELAFLTELDVPSLQSALQQLLSTHMLRMSSSPLGSSYQTEYTLNDLARSFVAKHQPVEPEKDKLFHKRRNQLIDMKERVKADQSINRYSFYTIDARSSSQLIIAKYLKDAIKLIQRSDFQKAEPLISTAKSLSPEFFEVHRVEALWFVEQKNYPAARQSYEAAIELEPKSAPLRVWFGGFLMRCCDDIAAALAEYRVAESLDPSEPFVLYQIATAYLYLSEFSEAEKRVVELISRKELFPQLARKCWDLYLQVFRRRAIRCWDDHDAIGAMGELKEMRAVFAQCPREVIDEHIRRTMCRAGETIDRCISVLDGQELKSQAVDLMEWLHAEFPDFQRLVARRARRASHIGKVFKMHEDFGYLITAEGNKLFFHKSYLVSQDEWLQIKRGSEVQFCFGENEKGPCARHICLVAQTPH